MTLQFGIDYVSMEITFQQMGHKLENETENLSKSTCRTSIRQMELDSGFNP